ncbi:MAG: histidine kinase [Sphaerochaetaceae bacterium]|nr:histidine kinase [Sphaerochaetaceae bacterium]
MQKKVFLWFVLIVVLPSGIIYFVVNHLLIRYVTDQQIANNYQLIQEMRKNLDTKLYHYQQLTMQFYLNGQAMEEVSSDLPIMDCTGIQNQLDSFVNSNRLVVSAFLITDKGIASSGTGIQGIERIHQELQPMLLELEGRIHWSDTYPLVTNFGLEDTFFFGARHIRQEQRPIATLMLGFNSIFFEDFFQYTPFEENQVITLITPEGTVIASNHQIPDAAVRDTPAGTKGNPYVTLSSLSNASDWEITLTLDTREISGELTYLRDMFNLSAILYIIFFLIISLLISHHLTKPIHALTWAVNKVGEGIMDVQVDVNHIDEIKQLSIGFNAMTDRIQKLLEAVKLEEQNKRKAHLQTLQLQLTPHLLYNSLNTIRWMAQINGQENIKRITMALTRYMRSLSDIDSEYITLRKELELLEDYAEIQRFRYTDFTIMKEIPTHLLDACIHKLMVVNLVENSIIHGIADIPEAGIITVSAKADAETLYVTVADNGVGLPPEVIARLTDRRPRPDDTPSDQLSAVEEDQHTGLRNIQDRLHLYHGKDHALIIESTEGHGCCITIPIPLRIPPAS